MYMFEIMSEKKSQDVICKKEKPRGNMSETMFEKKDRYMSKKKANVVFV